MKKVALFRSVVQPFPTTNQSTFYASFLYPKLSHDHHKQPNCQLCTLASKPYLSPFCNQRTIGSTKRTLLYHKLRNKFINLSANFSGQIEQSDSCSAPHPRRAFLYVPGDNEKLLRKATGISVDSVCLDLEDGVAESNREKAREQVVECLNTFEFTPDVDVCVRINGVATDKCEKDLEHVLSADKSPNSICVPKIEEPGEIEWLLNKVYGLTRERLSETFKLHILFLCETPKGLLNLHSCCSELNEVTTMLKCNLVPDSIIFGSDDFCASIGATRTESAIEVLYARQKILMTAKMFNLQAIDMVYNDLKSEEGLKESCKQGKIMGYTGKQVINPKQIEIVQKTFTPSEAEIEWAEELIAQWQKASLEGSGVILFRGKMIDMPLVIQAQNTLRNARKVC